jgi:hypothetical protein
MDCVYCIDLDFFTQPFFHGEYYIERDSFSRSDFFATAKQWIMPETFVERLKLVPTRGCTVKDDNQPFFYWKQMIAEGYLTPKKFTIVNFDAHHDLYLKYNHDYYKSLGIYNNYDNMMAPFVHDWVDEIIWVTPDYYTGDTIRQHFSMMNVNINREYVTIHVSQDYDIKIKVLRWAQFVPADYTPRYLSMILNSSMGVSDSRLVQTISKYVWQF